MTVFIIILLPLVLHIGEHDMTYSLFKQRVGRSPAAYSEVTWRNFCIRKWGWDNLKFSLWARIRHFYICMCVCTDTYTHTRDKVYFTRSTSGNDAGIVKRFHIPSRKPLGYKKNHPTSNKPIRDISHMEKPYFVLFQQIGPWIPLTAVAAGAEAVLSPATTTMLWTARIPVSLGCASTKWYHLWGVLGAQDI